jgi:peroxidase
MVEGPGMPRPDHRGLPNGRKAFAAAGLALLVTVLLGTGLASARRGAPEESSPPAVTGTAQVGETLSGTTGTWRGSTPMSFAYQWVRCDAGCRSIDGTTAPTYTLTAADAGTLVRLRVTATNSVGSRTALASPIGPVIDPMPVVATTVRTLNGAGNNLAHADWGEAGTQYLRVAATNYIDGIAQMPPGPPTRYVSNRIFNDVGQNLFSENDITQWGWAWGQFMDHDFGLRDETPAERAPIAFNPSDRLETFTNDFGAIGFSRTPAAPGTGVTTPRQQINTLSSYIDGSNVYGVTDARLDWLRAGTVDGNPANNEPRLLLSSEGYLPRADARGDSEPSPPMDLMGALTATPKKAVVAGDVRANENIALTAIHTLFAREHNRIVGLLPRYLPTELKFQIARRVVGAEEQFITYDQFLPELGVELSRYRGYDPSTNSGLSNEFAVVGYRAHSMIHGTFEPAAPAGTWSAEQLASFEDAGIEVEPHDDVVTLQIPLTLAFGNPDLLQEVGVGPVLQSLGAERQYRNDEQIDNSLRSVLFQVPKPGVPDPSVCGQPVIDPDCFTGVQDLGALDVERARDHGIPSYNALRRAYGLEPKRSFPDVTGEHGDSAGLVKGDLGRRIDDPRILDFVSIRDRDGNLVPLGSPEAQEEAVTGLRRTTLASRLKEIYGDVDKLDAFVGMVSAPRARHRVRGTAARHVEEAVRKRARRRPTLLPQRSGTARDPAPPRNLLPAHAERADPAEYRRRGTRRRLQSRARITARNS